MQVALVDGLRCEPAPGLSGACQACKSPMISKCGKIRAKHWAHRAKRRCDPWWEETDWHLTWKGRFPVEWREIVHQANNGEKHIADVKTPDRRVIEFQHSPLPPEEREAREAFYESMIWVVDGRARKRDGDSFNETVRIISKDPLVLSAIDMKCALFRDWSGRPVDVFLDFHTHALWHLHPFQQARVILTPVPVTEFIDTLHKGRVFERIPSDRNDLPVPVAPTSAPNVPMRPLGRRHFRF